MIPFFARFLLKDVFMATYKLNIARIRGCPAPEEVIEAMNSFGLPETEEFGVLNCSSNAQTAFGTIIRKTNQAVQKINPETKEVTATAIEKITIYPFSLTPGRETVEVYAGSASGIEQVGLFMSSCLAMPTVVDAIELDVASAIEKLAKSTNHFQLRSIRVSDYAHNSFMAGPYSPKFLDSQHGIDFLDEYVDFATTASVRFAGPTGRANVTLNKKACFSFSCTEDDHPAIQLILRTLV